jgi:hypothetical protein
MAKTKTKTGSNHPKAKLSKPQVNTIRRQLAVTNPKKKLSLAAIARMWGVTPPVIARIRDGKSYKDVV